jgi:L-lactate permease
MVVVRSSRQWILYSLLRIGVFAVAMGVLVLLGARPWLAAIIAAVIGLCISYLFLSRQREAVVASIDGYRRSKHVDADAEAENEALDADDRIPPAAVRLGDRSEGERGSESESEHQRREAGEL